MHIYAIFNGSLGEMDRAILAAIFNPYAALNTRDTSLNRRPLS
jgi:hypothetical protein